MRNGAEAMVLLATGMAGAQLPSLSAAQATHSQALAGLRAAACKAVGVWSSEDTGAPSGDVRGGARLGWMFEPRRSPCGGAADASGAALRLDQEFPADHEARERLSARAVAWSASFDWEESASAVLRAAQHAVRHNVVRPSVEVDRPLASRPVAAGSLGGLP